MWIVSKIVKYDYFIGNGIIVKEEVITDLGVDFDNHLRLGLQLYILEKREIKRMHDLVYSREIHACLRSVLSFYKAMVSSQLEYTN